MTDVYVRGEALSTTRIEGHEFVALHHASRDVGLLLSMIKMQMEASGETLDREDQIIADQIATDYGLPRWAANY